jgi:hypothetical protein
MNQVLARRAGLLCLNGYSYSDHGENQQDEKHYSLHVRVLPSVRRRIFNLVQFIGDGPGVRNCHTWNFIFHLDIGWHMLQPS